MSSKNVLIFNNYSVDRLHFEAKNVDGDGKFEIHPKFNKEIKEITENTYDVILSFLIEQNDNKELPFVMDVCMTGHFQLDLSDSTKEMKAELLNKNAVAILFPFLRSIIANITSCANVPPLILPIINLADSN